MKDFEEKIAHAEALFYCQVKNSLFYLNSTRFKIIEI